MIVEFFASLDPEVIVFALSNGNEGGVSNVESSEWNANHMS
jgi:hypothetical protein